MLAPEPRDDSTTCAAGIVFSKTRARDVSTTCARGGRVAARRKARALLEAGHARQPSELPRTQARVPPMWLRGCIGLGLSKHAALAQGLSNEHAQA